jgi:hypothetical protein
MRFGLVFTVILALAGSLTLAQQLGVAVPSPGTVATPAGSNEHFPAPPAGSVPASEQDVIVISKTQATHLHAPPSKGAKLRDFPRRFLHSINPFARTAPAEQVQRTGSLSPRAWTSTVGWHPGQSAFPDPLTHESSMGMTVLSY